MDPMGITPKYISSMSRISFSGESVNAAMLLEIPFTDKARTVGLENPTEKSLQNVAAESVFFFLEELTLSP